MNLIDDHYYECLSPPMPNFTKGKVYQVFSDGFYDLAVYPDPGAKIIGPVSAAVWIDDKHFVDVTDKYTGHGEERFTHEYKIAYVQSRVGQTVGRQQVYQVTAGSKDEALALFENQKVEGYNYNILYWES